MSHLSWLLGVRMARSLQYNADRISETDWLQTRGANRFNDLGLGIAGSCLGKLMVSSAGLIFEGVATGSFFTRRIPLLLGLSSKDTLPDSTFVSTVKLPTFVTDACDVYVFR